MFGPKSSGSKPQMWHGSTTGTDGSSNDYPDHDVNLLPTSCISGCYPLAFTRVHVLNDSIDVFFIDFPKVSHRDSNIGSESREWRVHHQHSQWMLREIEFAIFLNFLHFPCFHHNLFGYFPSVGCRGNRNVWKLFPSQIHSLHSCRQRGSCHEDAKSTSILRLHIRSVDFFVDSAIALYILPTNPFQALTLSLFNIYYVSGSWTQADEIVLWLRKYQQLRTSPAD